MQSLSEAGNPSSPENQRRPRIPPIKCKERKNDKGKDKLSKGKMSALFGQAKDTKMDSDKINALSTIKDASAICAMDIEVVDDDNGGMKSPLPAPPAPINLLSPPNDKAD
ncbi:unnamed protein product [Vitrella brassicaformis CCMP3155]|uniref:Uncharacterized protein n=1 Tax=Vitrella brassicaformis (strain CCMP3155) TaxID=1169540 RepID=A0A0G4FDK9_VITBC|nr:unnamed protein product [Vitrella brassicaformis CCMP3155]|eukprot:CEM11013.1 unnamed protein product [Vitrella brassicaformis CCMP3155]